MKVVNRPLLWLVFQAVLLCSALQFSGIYQMSKSEDSSGYENVAIYKFTNMINYCTTYHIRTFGYPLFLKFVSKFSPSFALLPLCQFAVHALAVLVFYLGLRHHVASGWLAMIISSSLLYSNTIIIDGSQMMTDAPALSLAILTIGMLLLVIGRPHSPLAWTGLALGLFLSYQTRPAYLFLIPLVPVLGMLLLGLVSPRPEWMHLHKRVGVGFIIASTLPFLAFCTGRWAWVGHFGLVSLGGWNIASNTTPFLTDDLVHDLPDNVRPLALRILENKRHRAAGPTDDERDPRFRRLERAQPDYQDYDYMRLRSLGNLRGVLYMLRETIRKSDDYYFMQDMGACHINLEAYRSLYPNTNNVIMNKELSNLAWEIIKARPLSYVRLVAKFFLLAIIAVLYNSLEFHALLLLLLLTLIVWHTFYVIQRLRAGPPTTEEVKSGSTRDYALELNLTLLITVSFTLGMVLVISLGAVPALRFTDAAGVFLPTTPMVALFALWGKIWGLSQR